MEEFHYLVVNAEGKQQKYHISGRDENSARYELKKRGITVIKKLSLSSSNHLADVFRPAGRFNLLEFNNQLTPLLEGAIPLAKALEIMEKYPSNERNLNIVHIIRQGLHDGKSFSTLLQEHPDEFPVLYSAMIESGEQSGNLTTVTGELSKYLKNSQELKNFIIISSIYPIIVLTVSMIVTILLFTVFLPKFATIFKNMGKKLPLITEIMLKSGDVISVIWPFILLMFIALIVAFKLRHKAPALANYLDSATLKMPLLGKIISNIQCARFMRTFAIMSAGNVHLLTALKTALKTISNKCIAENFAHVEYDLRKGVALSEIFSHIKLMPPGCSAMIKIAEESGNLPTMLKKITDDMEEQIHLKIKKLLAFFEPVVILLLALLVLVIVLAIFMAILEMNVIKP